MDILETVKKLFGMKPGADMGTLIASGAKIIDVRTASEFAGGHLQGSINIPLNVLRSKMGKLKKDGTIITCCASGMRSSSAKSILQSSGFTQVYNGGSWRNLTKYQ